MRDHRDRVSRSIAQRTSELLGFDGPTGNTYGSIATVDYLLENLSATAVTIVGRRPRRAGPAALVHGGSAAICGCRTASCSAAASCRRSAIRWRWSTRASIGSRALGQCQAVMLSVHNTPFGDIVDTEDDLQPLVHAAFRDATRAVALVAAAMRDAQFDVEKMRRRAPKELHHRDRARRHARARAGACRSASRMRLPSRPDREQIRSECPDRRAGADAGGGVEGGDRDARSTIRKTQLREDSQPRALRRVRKTLGGPAPDVTAAAIEASPTRALVAGSRLADGTRRRAGRRPCAGNERRSIEL